jgi:hypothetical protein
MMKHAAQGAWAAQAAFFAFAQKGLFIHETVAYIPLTDGDEPIGR